MADPHKRLRRVLSVLFLLVFAVATPAIIIMTAGYRYNFIKGRIERTGVLFVSTSPSRASVDLNGKATGKDTPARIKSLLPGTYHVVLHKNGFLPWERMVEIRSRETTFLNNVLLLKRDFPALSLEAELRSATFSPDRRFAALVEEGPSLLELRIVDLKTGASFLPYRTEDVSGAELRPSWSPGGGRLLVERVNGEAPHFLVWEENAPEEMTDLSDAPPSVYEHAFWSEEGRFLYAAAEGRLYRIDLRSRSAIDDGPAAAAMRVLGGTAYGLVQDKNETLFVERSLRDDAFTVVGALPGGNYERLGGSSTLLTFADRRASRLLLVDPSSEPGALEYVELRGSEAEWTKEDVLLYWTPLELHAYDAKTNADRLITRLGKPLVDAEHHPRYAMVFYADGEVVYASDEGAGYGRGVTEIARMSRIDRIVLDKNGAAAWLVGAIGEREGLWTLQLR